MTTLRTSWIYAALALAALAGAMLLFRGGDEPIANVGSSGKSVVAFGDSLVEGVGSTKGNDFVSELSRRAGVPIVNMGRSGDTTEDGLARVDDVLRREPKVVIVLLGGNDFLRKVPKAETFRNLGRIIERLQGGGAAVVLLGVRGGVFADEYDSEFRALAKRYRTGFVPDVLKGVITERSLMSDAIHPNDKGYERIAERALPELERALGKGA